MKQMRSRFRLITLLLVCAFLMVIVLCTGSVLKTAGISLPSLSSLPLVTTAVSPDPADSSVPLSEPSLTPDPGETLSPGTADPGTDNSPNPEYNVFGL